MVQSVCADGGGVAGEICGVLLPLCLCVGAGMSVGERCCIASGERH